MSSTRIKICGIRDPETAFAAVEAGADMLGFVLTPESSRYIGFEPAHTIIASLPPHVETVAVFKSQTVEDVLRWRGNWVQLHGDEDEAYASRITAPTIKGFLFNAREVGRWNQCADIDRLLIDGSAGGRGESFSHDELGRIMSTINKPVMLAGGLTPDNVGRAIRTIRPFAVDVSSGVESTPGLKDHDLIRAFCQAVRDADAELSG